VFDRQAYAVIVFVEVVIELTDAYSNIRIVLQLPILATTNAAGVSACGAVGWTAVVAPRLFPEPIGAWAIRIQIGVGSMKGLKALEATVGRIGCVRAIA